MMRAVVREWELGDAAAARDGGDVVGGAGGDGGGVGGGDGVGGGCDLCQA